LIPRERSDSAAAGSPLDDFPLHGDGPGSAPLPPASSAASAPSPAAPEETAPIAPRLVAFAADAAGTSLAVTLALVAAVAATGRAPRLPGLAWAAVFAFGFSFAFVALPLTLFGRTVGMSLAGLAARAGAAGRGLTPSEATRRWLGTVGAAAGLGLPLLFTRRDRMRPTPADRLSGRPLVREFSA
jgi:hypothetical protein